MLCFPLKYVKGINALKSKAGECWALSRLHRDSKAKIRPLVELHPHATRNVGDHLERLCEHLQAAWGENRWFYVDSIWLHGNSGSPAIIGAVFENSEACNLNAVPVVRTSYDDASLEQLHAVITENDRGYLIRVNPETLNSPQLINNVIEAMEVPRKRVDFLLDYRQRSMALAEDVPKIPNRHDWRSLIAASGVFPSSLVSLPLRRWQLIPRQDWLSWQAGIESDIEKTPIYSDYAMRSTGPPPGFGVPSVNLRYTLETGWLVQIGGRHADGAAPEMHGMCRDLVSRPDYSGSPFSMGDEEINRV